MVSVVKDLKKELQQLKEANTKLERHLRKANEALQEEKEKNENLMRDLTQTKTRLDVSEATQTKSTAISDEYRQMMTDNEQMME
jgi:predicted  nucleic acid-binding Zn-ribbon protein